MGVCASAPPKKEADEFPRHFVIPHQGFASPAEPLNRSGGTAMFFSLRNPSLGFQVIGKDVARSVEEVEFYAEVNKLRDPKHPRHQTFKALLPFFARCPGILEKFPINSGPTPETRDLLVIERFGQGFSSPRIFDVKIGERTAVAGWKGKSQWAAWRANRLSKVTNSGVEGYRLEGADGAPNALKSLMVGNMMEKKHRRFQLQRLRASQFLSFFLDASVERARMCDLGDWQLIAIASVIDQLYALYAAIVGLPNQMWIGSSVALIADASAPQISPANCRVYIFDWGRSALSTEGEQMSAWPEYKQGLRRLLLEAALLFRTRVANIADSPITIEIWDFDVVTANDSIGCVTFPRPETRAGEFPLVNPKTGKSVVDGHGKPSTIELEISERPSRIGRKMFFIKVRGAKNLPAMDSNGKSDPLVRLLAGQYQCFQHSAVVSQSLNPRWDVEFALVAYPDVSRFSPLVHKISKVQGATEAELRTAIDGMLPAHGNKV